MLELKFKVTPSRKRVGKVSRNGDSQKRFGHRKSTTSKNKDKDTPMKHGYHTEDYRRRVVYEHYYNNEKCPFYVGQGKLGRAFVFKGNRRNDNYNEKVKDINLIKVNIVAIDIDKTEAENLEEKLIAKYKRVKDGGSLVNIEKRTTGGFKESQCTPIYQFTIDGKYITSFKSIVEASRQTKIPKTNIWCCANGYSSYSHAGGYKWRYTKEFTNIENTKKANYNYTNRDYKKEYKNYKEKYYEKYKAKWKVERLKNRMNKLKQMNIKLKLN